MRRIAGNVVLITVFLSLIALIIMPLAAEIQFNAAQKLVADSRWNNAGNKFNNAIETDPFSSVYAGGYAEFLKNNSDSLDNKILSLLSAEKLYKSALELNPDRAEYWVGLGQAQIMLFLEDKNRFSGKLKTALSDFITALRNDPNGFNVSYSIGYAGIAIWEYLDDNEKRFILSRLKYSLMLKPRYSEYIYPKLYQRTKDLTLLKQIMPALKQKQKMDFDEIKKVTITNAKPVVLRSDWKGITADGKNRYENGNMYWTGTIGSPILVPKGNSIIKLQAKGSPANGIYPYMVVELDGKEIGTLFVDSLEWKEYDFRVEGDGGSMIIGVTFTNDSRSKDGKEDRNLYIGRAEAI